MTLRAITGLLSIALHGAIVGVLLITPGGASLDQGSGEETFVVEQGIAIEGVSELGNAEFEVAAVEAPPPVLATPPPPEKVEDVPEDVPIRETQEYTPIETDEPPPLEQPKLHEDIPVVIGSAEGPEQLGITTEELPLPKDTEVTELHEIKPIEDLPEPPEEVREPEVQELTRPPDEPEQVAVIEQTQMSIEEQRAAGASQDGGRATALSAYRGKLYSNISRKKVTPRSRRVGTVVVRFTVGRQGELLSSEVTQSSGHQVLDEAAIASISRAAPFPPMPNEASDGPLVVSVPFKFSVR